MNPLTASLVAFAAALGMLVAGLRAAAGWARRHQTSTPPAGIGPRRPIPALAAAGYLTDAEADAAAATARDIDRLDAIQQRLFQHPLNALIEQAIRDLLPPDDRAWIRVHTGEFTLVGVA